jgi:hypothetical protein
MGEVSGDALVPASDRFSSAGERQLELKGLASSIAVMRVNR